MLFGPQDPSSADPSAQRQNSDPDLSIPLPRPGDPTIAERTPWTMYCRYPPPDSPGGIASRRRDSSEFEEADVVEAESDDSDLATVERTAENGGCEEIDAGALSALLEQLEIAREQAGTGRVLCRIETTRGHINLELPENGDAAAFALHALELAEGAADEIEIVVGSPGASARESLIATYVENLSEIYPGTLSDIAALDGLLDEYCGGASDDAYAAWLLLLPPIDEFPASETSAFRNIITVLEALSGKMECAHSSFCAAKLLIALPGYEPDLNRGTPEWLWYAKMDALVFESLSGFAPNEIVSASQLLVAVRPSVHGRINSEALVLYLNHARVLGDSSIVSSVLLPFLTTEIAELEDQTLAGLGHRAVLAIRSISARGR